MSVTIIRRPNPEKMQAHRYEIESQKRELRRLEHEFHNIAVNIKATRSFLIDAGELPNGEGEVTDQQLLDAIEDGKRSERAKSGAVEAGSSADEARRRLEALDQADRDFAMVLRSGEPRGYRTDELLERLNDIDHPVTAEHDPKKAVLATLARLIAGKYAYRTGPHLFRMRRDFR